MQFPGRSASPAVLAACAALIGLAVLSLLAVVSHLAGGMGAVALAGAFLFEGFSWASFFIPVYLVLLALLLVAPGFRPRWALMLIFCLVPMLTAGVLFQVVQEVPSVIADALAQSFGIVPSAILLFLLFVLELLAIANLPGGRGNAGTGDPAGKRPPAAPLSLPAWEERARAVFNGPLPPAPEIRTAADIVDAAFRNTDPGSLTEEAIAEAVDPEPEPPPAPDTDEAASEAAIIEVPDTVPTAAPDEDLAVPDEDTAAPDEDLAAPDEDPAAPDEDPAALDEDITVPAEVPVSGIDATSVSDDVGASDPEAQRPLPVAGIREPALREAVSRYAGPYSVPTGEVLKQRKGNEYWIVDAETRKAAQILTDALQEFNVQAEVTGIRKGPVITLFEVLPAQGVRISKIANLSDNIALRLAAPSVRIVAPIPGRHAVGIEVPNRTRATVYLKEMLEMEAMKSSTYEIPVALGKDILGEAQVIDLVQTPHLLIGGATNSGKSVLVNAIICSILFKKSPDEVRLLLIDPKIVELKLYNDVPHLLTPVITDPKRAFQALQYCISEMERRYTLLDALGARDIRSFNKKAKKERVARLPYIVIVIDEFADLMATTGKELESTLARLAAMARAVGIHMVLATQRPSIDVITGLIKANIPSRIAFMVANKFDSRIIVDAVGAEKLLGKGDMLFSAAWNPFPVRIQGAFVDDEETESIADYVKRLGPPQYIDDEIFFEDEEETYAGEPGNDPLMEKALEIVIQQGKASASYLQRRLKIGYNRAARIVEEMEMRGIVGPAQGSKPRDILHVPK